jgi:hypothetical protein
VKEREDKRQKENKEENIDTNIRTDIDTMKGKERSVLTVSIPLHKNWMSYSGNLTK